MSKINNLNFYLKNLEKKQIKPKVWEIKITAEINENRKWANRENQWNQVVLLNDQ